MFGSAHNDIADETDIDLVVQFVPGQRVIWLLSIQDRLSLVVQARPVNWHTLGDPSR